MGDAGSGFPPHSVPPQTRCSAASWNHCASGKGTRCPALCDSALLLWIKEVIYPKTPESPLTTDQGLEFPASLILVFLLAFYSPPSDPQPDLTTHVRAGILICSLPHLLGLDVDGIYRVSGNLAVVQKLRFLVDRGEKARGQVVVRRTSCLRTTGGCEGAGRTGRWSGWNCMS